MLRTICAYLCASVVAFLLGCSTNPTPTTAESDSLGDAVQLTRSFERAGEAYFSADMQWVVFQAAGKGEGHYAMYVAPLIHIDNGVPRLGDPVRVSPAGSQNTCGFFSPDGGSLIFASTAGKDARPAVSGYQRQGGGYRWDFSPGMDIFRADGWEPAVRASASGINLAEHRITNNDAYDAECAYSPDGKRIIFTSNRTGDHELYVMDAEGKNVQQLTHSPGYDGGPFFSPDGKSIVWRTDRKKKDMLQIHVADITPQGLKNEKAITNDKFVNWAPYWHPDGKHIVYTTSAHGHENYEIYVMRRDGSRKTRLTFTEGFDGLPVVSPDGKWLLWSSKRSGTTQLTIAQLVLPKGS